MDDDVVEWLHCTTFALNRAAENDHLDVIGWLHTNRQHDWSKCDGYHRGVCKEEVFLCILRDAHDNHDLLHKYIKSFPAYVWYGSLTETELKIVLDAGADPNLDHNDCVALIQVIPTATPAIINMLVAAGADPNYETDCEQTPLIRAVSHGRIEIVRTLLVNGADPNIETFTGVTALTMAIMSKTNIKTTIIAELLAAGADPNMGERNILELALSNNVYDIIPQLLAAGADPNKPFIRNSGHNALTYCVQCKQLNIELQQRLIEAGSNLGLIPDTDKTALMLSKTVQSAKLLLEAGSNINEQTVEDGWTALMFTTSYGNRDIVKFLIESRAQLDLQNKYGKTALIIAASKMHDDRRREIFWRLLAAGADPEIADNHGRTAWDHLPKDGLNLVMLDMWNRIQDLSAALHYAPGNEGFLEAKRHFSTLAAPLLGTL